jgi:hypothetical protein
MTALQSLNKPPVRGGAEVTSRLKIKNEQLHVLNETHIS